MFEYVYDCVFVISGMSKRHEMSININGKSFIDTNHLRCERSHYYMLHHFLPFPYPLSISFHVTHSHNDVCSCKRWKQTYFCARFWLRKENLRSLTASIFSSFDSYIFSFSHQRLNNIHNRWTWTSMWTSHHRQIWNSKIKAKIQWKRSHVRFVDVVRFYGSWISSFFPSLSPFIAYIFRFFSSHFRFCITFWYLY